MAPWDVEAGNKYQSHSLQQVTLQLSWLHQFQFAGYYAAVEKGFYRDAGFQVNIIEGKPGISSVDEVVSGRASYGVGGSEILIHRMHGKPIVALAAIMQHSANILLAKKESGINSPQDMIGQRVMLLKGDDAAEYSAMFRNEGVSLEQVNIIPSSYDINDLIEGNTDVFNAYSTNEPYYLKSKNIPITIIRPINYGIDFYGDCLFTSEQELKRNPDQVKAFREASLRGWEYAMEHPEEIINIILTQYGVKKTRDHLIFEASSLRKLIFPDLIKMGHMNPGRWHHMAKTYIEIGMADPEYSLKSFIYDPNPRPDYTRIQWALGVTVVLSLLVCLFSSLLWFHNRRLRIEVRQRKLAEEEQLKSRQFMFNVLESIQDGISVLNPDLSIRHVNSVMKKWYAQNLPLEGQKCFECYHNTDNPCTPCPVLRCLKSGNSEMDIVPGLPGSGPEWLELFSYPIKDDGTDEITGVVEFVRDITNSKKVEESLRESEKKYKQLFKNAPAGIYEVDFEKVRFLNVNDIMCKYSGYSEKEFLSMNPLDLLTEESRNLYIKRFDKHYKGEDLSTNVEYNILKKDGQELNVILSSDFIYKNGKVKGARVVAHDVTELKKAEQKILKAQKIAVEQKKLALVGQVAGKMAHDFNNILSVIMGNTELSLLDCKDAETIKTLELIFDLTLRGKNLTRNLVAFAKDQEPKQEFFRISEKIDLVVNLLRKDLDGIELIKGNKPGVPQLLADSGMIEHALVNLIQNSIHATSLNESPRIFIKTYCSGEKICIEIEDNGCGIRKEHLERIYEPSFTLKGRKDVTGSYESVIKGTGYGMANVKKYIEQHKGSISVESEFGSGTKFTVNLPIIKKELTIEEKIEIQKEKIHFDKYILLVEDEPAISGVQYRILSQEPCNHKVDIAHDGQVAIDLFDRNQYDFISLDYFLPGKINGMNVYDHIRKTDKTIPILFISGNIEFLESIKDLKQKDGNVDHLSKPCQNKDYVKRINELFERNLAS